MVQNGLSDNPPRALLKSELEEIFAKARPAPAAVATQKLASAYAEATGKSVPSQASTSDVKPQRDVDGQDCAVCYEEMQAKTQDDIAKLVFCDTCNNGLHTDCFRMCKHDYWQQLSPQLT